MKKWNALIGMGAILLIMSLGLSSVAYSQTDPRGAIPPPHETAGVLLYYRHIQGHEGYVDGNRVSKDTNLTSNISIVRPAYWGKLWDIDYNVNLILPFGDKQLMRPGAIDQTATGMGDPQLAGALWPIANREKGLYLAPMIYVTAPFGEYHSDRVVNMGANRWAVKPELDFTWRYEKWCFELQQNIEFYSDNDQYTSSNRTSSKDPVYVSLAHVSYDVTKSFWVGGSAWWTGGGETKVNGVKQNDDLANWTGMFSLNFKLTDNVSLLANYAHDFNVENGPGVDQIRLRLFYSW